jgi:DNA-directed RNA polymerase specialized sigma24 family protein
MDQFEAFVRRHEPRLRRALSAAYGPVIGVEAAAEAMAYAWQHADRILGMDNGAGYLFRVGQTAATRLRRPGPRFPIAEQYVEAPEVEPRLIEMLEALTESQRLCVVLVHAYAWTQQEVADLLGIEHATVRTHLARGLTKLRNALEVDHA